MSEERTSHLEHNEKWIMRIAVFFSSLALVSFTYTKWEVEAKLKSELNEEERKAWYGGAYDHEEALQNRRRHEYMESKPLPPVSLDGFVPASTFQGPREGMVFKSDDAGLGYYRDQPVYERVDAAIKQLVLPIVPIATTDYIPASSFDGARAGMVFKTGDQGLGYYKDVGHA